MEGMQESGEEYDVPQSHETKVPLWLKLSYFILVVWGFLAMYWYWGGSHGWLDRGYWQQLQKASNTTLQGK